MKISRRTALQGTAGAFALGLGGFNFDFTNAHAQAPAVKRGGTLNFAISAEAPHYDPHGSDTYATLHLAGPFYSTLMRFNLSKFPAIEGDLAQSWTVASDLMTYTFKLHPNVKFADGTSLTSADVRATYDRLRNPPQGVVSTRKATFADIDTIETPDPLTVVFKMKAVNASMLEHFASPWNVIYTAKDLAENPAGPRTKINGTGPFVFVEHIKGSHVAGKKNDNYFKKGLPYLDGFRGIFTLQAAAMLNAVQGGQVLGEFRGISPAERDRLVQAMGDKIRIEESSWTLALLVCFNIEKKPFDDVRVRRALVMAIDRPKWSQAVTNGLSRPASNPYGDGSWVKCQDDGALPFDLGKAQALLKDYGKPVKFKMLVTATPRGRTTGQVLQQFWKQAGAEMEIEQVDQTAIVTRAFARQFELTPWRIVDLADPDPQMYANFRTGSPVALANYSNPELDKLLDHARNTPDTSQRIEDYCAISRLINKEAIWFWAFQNTYYAIATSKLKGLPKIYHGVIDVSDTWLE